MLRSDDLQHSLGETLHQLRWSILCSTRCFLLQPAANLTNITSPVLTQLQPNCSLTQATDEYVHSRILSSIHQYSNSVKTLLAG